MYLDAMPGKCCVKYCNTNLAKHPQKLFRIPAENRRYVELSRERQELWLKALGIADGSETRLEHLRVCQDHFISGKSADVFDRNNPDWIPTVNMRNSPCSVNMCRTYPAEDKKELFPVPMVNSQNEELSKIRQARWLKAIGINDVDEDGVKSLRVCQDHFISGRSADFFDTENPDWVPTLNINAVEGTSGLNELDPSPDDFNFTLFENELANASIESVVEVGSEVVPCLSEAEISDTHMTVATATLADNELQGLHQQVLTLKERIQILEEMILEHTIRIDSFKNNDKKTRFFTGLTTYKTMNALFLSLETFLPECKNRLDKFQVFYIVLVRLRLNLSFRYLSYTFSISEQTISKYFHEGLYVMYSKLRSLVYWPERESIKKTMPESFQRCFGSTVSTIIDCFDIFLQRSSLMKAQSQTWSTYKHCNTIKYLIGITPQGLISFVSVGYGGRASDKYITENCGFLDLIQEGDVVMADRGFLVENALKDIGARTEIPAFTKGKSQLHPYEIESTRKIANVRIHVEREIGLLRLKYTILTQRQFPLHFVRRNTCAVSIIDQIVVLCAALINLCQPICVRCPEDVECD